MKITITKEGAKRAIREHGDLLQQGQWANQQRGAICRVCAVGAIMHDALGPKATARRIRNQSFNAYCNSAELANLSDWFEELFDGDAPDGTPVPAAAVLNYIERHFPDSFEVEI